MLLNKHARSIARIALAEQSLACLVQSTDCTSFSAKVVARRVTRECDSVHGESSSAKNQKSRFGLTATRLDSR